MHFLEKGRGAMVCSGISGKIVTCNYRSWNAAVTALSPKPSSSTGQAFNKAYNEGFKGLPELVEALTKALNATCTLYKQLTDTDDSDSPYLPILSTTSRVTEGACNEQRQRSHVLAAFRVAAESRRPTSVGR